MNNKYGNVISTVKSGSRLRLISLMGPLLDKFAQDDHIFNYQDCFCKAGFKHYINYEPLSINVRNIFWWEFRDVLDMKHRPQHHMLETRAH